MTVIATGELDDQIAAGEPAGQAQRGHGGLGAGGDHADLLHRSHTIHEQLGQFSLSARGCAEGQAALHGLVHRFEHHRVGVAQQRRTPRTHQVHVLAAVHIGQVRALGRGNERRGSPHGVEGAYRGVHATGHHALGTVEQFLGDTHEITWFLPPGITPITCAAAGLGSRGGSLT